MADWRCPDCGRSFVNHGQSHSCVRLSLDELFAGEPGARRLFEAVRKAVQKIGPTEIGVTKTQVSFRARIRFAWVWMPQRWIRDAPSGHAVLTFDLPRRLRSKRIAEVVKTRPSRFTHHVKLASARDVDAEVQGWLRMAYEAASRIPAGRKK